MDVGGQPGVAVVSEGRGPRATVSGLVIAVIVFSSYSAYSALMHADRERWTLGKVKPRKKRLVKGRVCETMNLTFLVTPAKVRDGDKLGVQK